MKTICSNRFNLFRTIVLMQLYLILGMCILIIPFYVASILFSSLEPAILLLIILLIFLSATYIYYFVTKTIIMKFIINKRKRSHINDA
ncbi:hypothetical protein Igag_1214 [Ignisphaera aggregans DSM 17230]|uniref:Uncharacterized protein n=1 Tax=Ignisphaera aggregans (strain DSM 17230 / JCM 13409 / AQ1.S1) TaxID=583356 RepID=E0SP93_IGNAA|nr:hypothetical protein Igag_1214 [Ignisphaera aggregans DSM 17230]